MFSTVVGRKVLSHFSFIATPCHYLINCMKDSCCFIDDYCSVIIILSCKSSISYLAAIPSISKRTLGKPARVRKTISLSNIVVYKTATVFHAVDKIVARCNNKTEVA